MHESIISFANTTFVWAHHFPPSSHTHFCAIFCVPSIPLCCNTYHSILVMAISRKGQGPVRTVPMHKTCPPHWFSPYTILCHFNALLWESIILVLPPPTCKAYPIAILLHAHFVIYAPPPSPLVYAIHHTILAMTTSCEGQALVCSGTVHNWAVYRPWRYLRLGSRGLERRLGCGLWGIYICIYIYIYIFTHIYIYIYIYTWG